MSALKQFIRRTLFRNRLKNRMSTIAEEIQLLYAENELSGVLIQNNTGDWHFKECTNESSLAPCVCTKIRNKKGTIKKLMKLFKK